MARTGTCSRLLLALALPGLVAACDDDACFAPGKNLSTAYEQGSVGCACSSRDPEQCLDGVALVCRSGRWRAVIDGPCWADVGPPGWLLDAQVEGSSPIDAGGGPEAVAPPKPIGEACGASTCSIYAYCSQDAGAARQCVAKGDPGDSCAEARTCMSGLCGKGSCEPQPNPQSCEGTWDCGALSIAETICRGRDCHVCVQTVTPAGEPAVWAAIEPASCPCPLPTRAPVERPPLDSGPRRDF
jgi:hypothetical protein